MLKVIIFVFLFAYVVSQDQCELNDDDVDSIQGDANTVPPRGYDVESARRSLSADRQQQFDDDLKTTQALTSVDKDKIDDIIIKPVPGPQSLCPSVLSYVWIKQFIWFNQGICYVLQPWWNQVFTSLTKATCQTKQCQNLPCITWLTQYRWLCSQTNYKTFYIWVYCPNSKFPYKRLPLRLPQCCECRRHRVFFELPGDFTASVN